LKNDDEPEVDIYAEIGIQCPFLLAKHQGIKLTYIDDLGDICGMYKKTATATHRIYLNSSIDIESQEAALFFLLKHHNNNDHNDHNNIERKGTQHLITKNDLSILKGLGRKIQKYNNILVDIFLNGSLFGYNKPY
jgi:hypothetical protein